VIPRYDDERGVGIGVVGNDNDIDQGAEATHRMGWNPSDPWVHRCHGCPRSKISIMVQIYSLTIVGIVVAVAATMPKNL
jgi:hypothetical protein